MDDTRILTVQLPGEAYSMAQTMAAEREISLDSLIAEGLKLLESQQPHQALFEDFTALGEDLEVSDVEFAIGAQNEIVANEE
ncbi:MAG: hypothetical protein ACI8UO_004246 [Verrucomicrobiales bacterium]|jgi:hypothetical protein